MAVSDRVLTLIVLLLSILGVCLLVVVVGITAASLRKLQHPQCASSSASPALGLPGIGHYTWEDVVAASYGQTVQFWASSVSNYDYWIDSFLAPQMSTLYGITIVRIPMSDEGAAQATDQIAAEMAAGNDNNGSVGLVWTNGPDFYAERTQNLLYGPWAYKVPNAVNFDFNSPAISSDFGQPTAGYEFPYNSAQITFSYNPSCGNLGTSPPQSMAELVNWVVSNPGKFTYANPGGADGDYTGSAFIRHFLYEFGGGYEHFQGGYNAGRYTSAVSAAFAQLRLMEPGIYQLPATTTPYYPANQTLVDNLFALGEICLTLSYDPDHAGQLVHTPQESGVLNWPNNTVSYLPASGTIGNVNFVAISYNAGSLFGALVVANYIGGMAAQYSRRSIVPPGIGTIQAYNPTCEAIVDGGWSVPFSDLPSYPETPSAAELDAAFMPEINPQYALQMQIDWTYCVQQNLATASGTGGSGASCT